MIIDGEKYACEACVRGHRVSNCQHSDRPLQHINKKGRPISQCAHCRSMRKSRSAHIKCDCGEKTSKCAHLQPTVDGHTETCCCNHGGRCTCSLKKEPSLDTVPESDSEREATTITHAGCPKPPMRRRRANTIHADGGLSFDQNGHHKPAAKHNRAAQKCNPYQLNRVNSTASASSLISGPEGLSYQANGDLRSAPRSVGAREQRMVKSETASPLMSGSSFPQLSGLPHLDLSRIDYPSYADNGSFDMFGSGLPSDHEGPIYSAGLSAASVDWSHYDLAESKAESLAPSSYSQAGTQSFNGLFEFGSGSEQLPRLANTTSTSGDVSEVEDFLPGGDGDIEGFGAGSGSFLRAGPLGNAADLSSIDYDSFYKNADSAAMSGSGVSLVEEDPAFWMPNYNDGIATVEESPDPLGASAANNFWQM
ncbi:hypothetical protein K4F52_006735 [Lecanicillium sp. MT-2017a]|nr:hypothetical protein K4F52_006735 [Lecanicillium sp. MT-2017a]